MRETLLLRADSVTGDHWYWQRLDENGVPGGGLRAGGLADAAAEATGARVVVLVAGEVCLLTQARIPGRSRQKLLRAVPFALEEQLSDEVEHLHFAIGDSQADGSWPVAVIGRSHMDALVAAFESAAIEVQQLVPEQLAVPWREGEISVLILDDMALVRTGPVSGFAADVDNLDLLLSLQQEGEPLPRLRLYVQADRSAPEIDSYGGEILIEPWAGDSLTLLAGGLQERSINLLQGDYSRSGNWQQLWRPWRATAALLLAGILVSYLATAIAWYRLGREDAQLRSEIEQTFRKASPETRRVVNPRAQMQQLLDGYRQGGGADNGFLVLLGKTGSIIRDNQGIELAAITFRSGRLDLDLRIGTLQQLDQFKQALSGTSGLDVEIQSATTGTDNRVQSRLRIQGKGA